MARRATTPTPLAPAGSVARYRDRIYDDPRHDPYQDTGKLAEPTVCSDCHAVYQHGRWLWAAAPPRAAKAVCPACRRIRDRQPAGYVKLAGVRMEGDRDALIGLVRNVEKHENVEHPLHRIMDIEQDADEVRVTTTDTHLPQRIGEAVKHAYKGLLDIAYGEDEYVVRVRWQN
jgi:hypothetical protein